MIDKHLICITILIVYVCVCLITVTITLYDPREPSSNSQYYITNIYKAEEDSRGDLLLKHHLNIKPKALPETFHISKLREDDVLTLPKTDFQQLIDLHNFKYLIHQPRCSDHIEALILIHSAPKNYEKRQIIRETWGSIANHTRDCPFRILFLLGAVGSEQLQDQLQSENSSYNDIIQGSFTDDYRNMTYKHIMAFKWCLYNCPHAQILLKVDDDVYVNTPQLLKYFRQQQQHTNMYVTNQTMNTTSKKFNASRNLFNHPENLLFCETVFRARVSRSYRSKWRISFREYSESHYPSYCSGYVLIYSTDVVFRLYKAAQNYKYFWIDDVHVTGVLAHRTNTSITMASPYVLYSHKWQQLLSGKIGLHELEFIYASYEISAQQIKSLWDLQKKSFKSLYDL